MNTPQIYNVPFGILGPGGNWLTKKNLKSKKSGDSLPLSLFSLKINCRLAAGRWPAAHV